MRMLNKQQRRRLLPSRTRPLPQRPEIGSKMQYFTTPPHSIWNPYGMDIFHGFHMDSIWNMFQDINQVITTMDSTWIPHGFHAHSIWIPYGLIPPGIHMESTPNPCGIHVDSTWNSHNIFSQVKSRKFIFDNLITRLSTI